jgi:hypothetical protein
MPSSGSVAARLAFCAVFQVGERGRTELVDAGVPIRVAIRKHRGAELLRGERPIIQAIWMRIAIKPSSQPTK